MVTLASRNLCVAPFSVAHGILKMRITILSLSRSEAFVCDAMQSNLSTCVNNEMYVHMIAKHICEFDFLFPLCNLTPFSQNQSLWVLSTSHLPLLEFYASFRGARCANSLRAFSYVL